MAQWMWKLIFIALSPRQSYVKSKILSGASLDLCWGQLDEDHCTTSCQHVAHKITHVWSHFNLATRCAHQFLICLWRVNYTNASAKAQAALRILHEWQPRNHTVSFSLKVCTCSKYSLELQKMTWILLQYPYTQASQASSWVHFPPFP